MLFASLFISYMKAAKQQTLNYVDKMTDFRAITVASFV